MFEWPSTYVNFKTIGKAGVRYFKDAYRANCYAKKHGIKFFYVSESKPDVWKKETVI
jgi:hypothetical protein